MAERQKVRERSMPVVNTPLKRAREYEEHLGAGRVIIYEGHPSYCPRQQFHMPHSFEYEYLDSKDHPVAGSYQCDGVPFSFRKRED